VSHRWKPYLDGQGKPRLRDSMVAFLDVLGFSQMAMAHSGLEDGQRMLSTISTAIDDSRDFVRSSMKADEDTARYDWALKFFSDNLAFGFPSDTRGDDLAAARFMIRCVQRYELRMAFNGLFVRGALSCGPFCLTDEIIFGSALIECYQLESKASIVPRVVISQRLQKRLEEACGSTAKSPTIDCGDDVCRDVDGWWFVNYLEAAREPHGMNWSLIERHKQSVLDSLATTTRHDVLPKFGWACRYHNVFCHWHRNEPGYSDRYRIERVDEQSTIHRVSDGTNR